MGEFDKNEGATDGGVVLGGVEGADSAGVSMTVSSAAVELNADALEPEGLIMLAGNASAAA